MVEDVATPEHDPMDYRMRQEDYDHNLDYSKSVAGNGDTMRPRTEREQKANDTVLLQHVVEKVTPQLETMGLGDNTPGLHRIYNFRTEPMPHDAEGKIERHPTKDGLNEYDIVIASHIMESGDQTTITRVVAHEIGHALDMSLDGGIYSSQPEMHFGAFKGPVAREILEHFKSDGFFAENFSYPLKSGLGYEAITLAKESFAQAWHLYLDHAKRAIMELELPKTAKYLSEVLKHAQDSTTEIHRPAPTDTVQLRESFGKRAEQTGDASTTRSSKTGRSTGESFSRAVTETSGDVVRRAESLESKSTSRSSELSSKTTDRINTPPDVESQSARSGPPKPASGYQDIPDLIALRPRSEQEHQANDRDLHKNIDEEILPRLAEIGITEHSPGLNRVESFHTEPMPHAEDGEIQNHKRQDGVAAYRIVVASHVIEGRDAARIADAVHHEIAHAVDMPFEGGIYSAQPELRLTREAGKGELEAAGVVAEEILKHYAERDAFADMLDYPLHRDYGYSVEETAQELFAQIFSIYQNKTKRPILEAMLPKTAHYLQEVMQHVKDSTAEKNSPSVADAQRLRESFRNRDGLTQGQPDNAPGLTDLQGAAKPDTRASKRHGGDATGRTESLPGKNEGAVQLYSRVASDTSPAERIAVAERYIKKLPASVQAPVRSVTENISHFATRGLQSAAFLHDLADWAGKHGMTAMKEVSRLYSEKGAFKSELDKRLGKITELYDRLDKPDQEAAARVGTISIA